MQAHRGVRGLSIDTTSLKIGSVVSRKTIFFRKVKKICKTSKKSPVTIFFYIIPCFIKQELSTKQEFVTKSKILQK